MKTISGMEEISYVGKNQCSSSCLNPLLHHDIGHEDNEDTNEDTESVTVSEENVALIEASRDSNDKVLNTMWIPLIVLSILLVSLFITGHFLIATLILCCSAGIALAFLVKALVRQTTWGGDRDYYSEL